MKKLIILLSIVFLALPKQASANENVVSTSGDLKVVQVQNSETTLKVDHRAETLNNYFERINSPLIGQGEYFVYYADKYAVDWRLVAAISGVESTFGKNMPANSYNAYGWANGNYYFESWDDSIETVTKTLKERYLDRGADTVEKIAPIYAPPSTTWAWKVNYFMEQIEPLPIQFDL